MRGVSLVSKRTQFRNQHPLRQAPKVMQEALLSAQTCVIANPERKKEIWATTLYGMAEWWKYKRLKAAVKHMLHKPRQGKQEKARRLRMGSAAYRGAA